MNNKYFTDFLVKKIKNIGKILPWLFILVVVVVAGWVVIKSWPKTSDDIKQLQEVEVQEYKGENLSSIADFRENSIKGVQYINKEDYQLEITGLVEQPQTLDYEQVVGNDRYSKVVTLNCVEGWSAKILWEGVLIKDLLTQAQLKPEANTVIFYAADGYSSSLSLDYILDNNIILADKMNGVELPAERGFPFQVVAEDKWGYKWVKWVTKIEISDDPEYKGYWEEAGYNQRGDVSGPKFE